MLPLQLTEHDVDVLIVAVQRYRTYTEQQVKDRKSQKWDVSEQETRIIQLDDLEERLFGLLS